MLAQPFWPSAHRFSRAASPIRPPNSGARRTAAIACASPRLPERRRDARSPAAAPAGCGSSTCLRRAIRRQAAAPGFREAMPTLRIGWGRRPNGPARLQILASHCPIASPLALLARPSRSIYTAPRADVAQLARASACHAEGRGFESLHPLRGLGCRWTVWVRLASLVSAAVRPGSGLNGRVGPLGQPVDQPSACPSPAPSGSASS